ncbi:MAG: hypothetical protein P4L43_20785 [Syntrophobacteraceae bacterium]|nr:hypothetical protein [Syntrophobacteraceae bacterium]
MRSMLIMVLAAGLALLPYGAPVGAQEKTSSESPPIEHPPVSEGQFAVRLAEALGVASSREKAAAEDSLARANIAPRSGWVSDYPMTPDIIEEVRQSASMSASAGGLNMSEAGAARAVTGVSAAMNLPTRSGGQYGRSGYSLSSHSTSSEYESARQSAPPPEAPALGAPVRARSSTFAGEGRAAGTARFSSSGERIPLERSNARNPVSTMRNLRGSYGGPSGRDGRYGAHPYSGESAFSGGYQAGGTGGGGR